MKRNNPPAFPIVTGKAPNLTAHMGLTQRDYFAANAPEMTDQWFEDSGGHWLDAQASWAYAYADAMLKARDATPARGST